VELDAVQKALGVKGNLVEIGVWHGRGAILFHHLLNEGECVYAVDIFDLRESEHSHFNDPAILQANMRNFGCDDGRLVPVRMDTSKNGHKLLNMVKPKTVRILHIDGGHNYEVVRRDIEIARRTLGKGAVLVFDDFFNHKHPGTTQAIMEFLLLTPDIAPFLITEKKLWVCDVKWHREYLNRMKKAKVASGKSKLFRRTVLLS
jgi:hypothetical protein